MQQLEDYTARLEEIIVARNDNLVQARDTIVRGASTVSHEK